MKAFPQEYSGKYGDCARIDGSRRISHYRILKKLAAGGMGEVYLAEDTRLGRRAAIKLLPEGFTKDPERVRLFVQEVKAASALR